MEASEKKRGTQLLSAGRLITKTTATSLQRPQENFRKCNDFGKISPSDRQCLTLLNAVARRHTCSAEWTGSGHEPPHSSAAKWKTERLRPLDAWQVVLQKGTQMEAPLCPLRQRILPKQCFQTNALAIAVRPLEQHEFIHSSVLVSLKRLVGGIAPVAESIPHLTARRPTTPSRRWVAGRFSGNNRFSWNWTGTWAPMTFTETSRPRSQPLTLPLTSVGPLGCHVEISGREVHTVFAQQHCAQGTFFFGASASSTDPASPRQELPVVRSLHHGESVC